MASPNQRHQQQRWNMNVLQVLCLCLLTAASDAAQTFARKVNPVHAFQRQQQQQQHHQQQQQEEEVYFNKNKNRNLMMSANVKADVGKGIFSPTAKGASPTVPAPTSKGFSPSAAVPTSKGFSPTSPYTQIPPSSKGTKSMGMGMGKGKGAMPVVTIPTSPSVTYPTVSPPTAKFPIGFTPSSPSFFGKKGGDVFDFDFDLDAYGKKGGYHGKGGGKGGGYNGKKSGFDFDLDFGGYGKKGGGKKGKPTQKPKPTPPTAPTPTAPTPTVLPPSGTVAPSTSDQPTMSPTSPVTQPPSTEAPSVSPTDNIFPTVELQTYQVLYTIEQSRFLFPSEYEEVANITDPYVDQGFFDAFEAAPTINLRSTETVKIDQDFSFGDPVIIVYTTTLTFQQDSLVPDEATLNQILSDLFLPPNDEVYRVYLVDELNQCCEANLFDTTSAIGFNFVQASSEEGTSNSAEGNSAIGFMSGETDDALIFAFAGAGAGLMAFLMILFGLKAYDRRKDVRRELVYAEALDKGETDGQTVATVVDETTAGDASTSDSMTSYSRKTIKTKTKKKSRRSRSGKVRRHRPNRDGAASTMSEMTDNSADEAYDVTAQGSSRTAAPDETHHYMNQALEFLKEEEDESEDEFSDEPLEPQEKARLVLI
mmetsp:Transcript_22521/g.49068  ORF Transcript_22521/g.49068 Transcript_22521/m.49068 type:complete len:647 (-) Transcript_22521:438-2378(-)